MRRKPFIQPKNKLYLTIQLHYYNTSMLSYFIKSFQNVVALASLICFLGCATGSTIITGSKRAVTDPAEVTVYLDPPSKYETIGIVEASSAVGLSRQSAQDRVIGKLKSLAAKSGANAILLTSSDSQSSSPGTFNNGFYYGGSSDQLTGQARAIFVTSKED